MPFRTLLLLLAAMVVQIQSAFAQAECEKHILIGSVDSLYSQILDEPRQIWVHVPASFHHAYYSPKRYPVAYLLDGDAHFSSVVGMIEQLSAINRNYACPEMIIVGILNTDRTRDLTPTHVDSICGLDNTNFPTSGGGENFTAFVAKELMPYIDSIYPTLSYRMLIGHSFGGLFAINTFLHHTNMFNAYIALDPSLWWDDQVLIKQCRQLNKQKNFKNKRIYIASANLFEPGLDTALLIKDTSFDALHMRSIFEFKNALASNSSNDLIWFWKFYDKEDHGLVPLLAEYDALRFIFNYYPLPTYSFQKNMPNPFHKYLESHYRKVSQELGCNFPPPEAVVNEFGYDFILEKKYDHAFGCLQMNIDNYPESYNTYGMMGDYYLAIENKKKAIEFYEKALNLKAYRPIQDMVKKLKAK